jgi:hypothetical protein
MMNDIFIILYQQSLLETIGDEIKKALWWASRNIFTKAVDGFEPTIKLLQSRALPLGYTAATLIILS